MYHKIIFTGLLVLALFAGAQAQPTAKVSYVTSAGNAFFPDNKNLKLKTAQLLYLKDQIVIENDAGIRILFLDLHWSEKYHAPDTISIGAEFERLKNRNPSADRTQRAVQELNQAVGQYLAPKYNRPAGTRGIQIVPQTIIHDLILTFRQQSAFVVRGVNQARELSIFRGNGNQPGELVTRLPVPQGNGFVVVTIPDLQYDSHYFWKLTGETQPGQLKLVSRQKATEAEAFIRQLETEALDEIEKAQLVGTWLFNQHYWAEALAFVRQGLERNPIDEKLLNLQQAILNLQPEDTAFRTSAAAGGELTLCYSFHVKKNNRLHEIYDGDTVHTGDRMQIQAEASEDCYLFILNLDAANRLYVLYPLENQDHQLTGKREIVIPDRKNYFQADTQTGVEKLFLVAAKIPLDFLAVELDKYFAVMSPGQRDAGFTRGLDGLRGFSTVVDEKGNAVQEVSPGTDSIQLSRLLKGKGLLVKEITFHHK